MENETNSQLPPNTTSRTSINTVEDGKTIGIIAYITIVGLIIAFVMNNEKKNSFAAYHIRQSLGLGITGLALSIINVIPILGWIVSILGSIFLIVLWVIGLMGAINGGEKPVPILGEKYQEWLKGI
ncbi:putative membrane protein [Aequorivita sublithincola DSM 14238]|uniref:Putative membrane protein n=1 Tax=Aequorivita sublithincola (strain DSM 14238 / LMG 21431 / ACAM 643 / 9-3) TaxID=746697 RepID=I3YX44_AEQSU|nr:hypothetical protein [Aequorivita sublithincola]AFL81562.1 putative membrane protein [Aequorivita sublithincola DSM 14238]